jgi:hypothetical protein
VNYEITTNKNQEIKLNKDGETYDFDADNLEKIRNSLLTNFMGSIVLGFLRSKNEDELLKIVNLCKESFINSTTSQKKKF